MSLKISSDSDLALVRKVIDGKLIPLGFETYAFKVGWYNAQVHQKFHLSYHEDTVAFIVLNTPHMFELAFKPYLRTAKLNGLKDPIDQCISHCFQMVLQELPEYNVEVIMDHELTPTRRPKVLVQTAGHVAGAVHYYQRTSLQFDPWDQKKKICGVAVHPRYGGWFALRGVMIFKDIIYPNLPRTEPIDVVPSQEKRLELLTRFNYNWKDWTFRDIIPVEARYSTEQCKYFATKPSERLTLLSSFNNELQCKDLESYLEIQLNVDVS